ncbi:hypothetical protein C8F04DRAFT_1114565 [Mycena alexandri]|uniref:Uncharacterized protein n=1 Tax=Mycena alexandri TaxID=1745969 RepID=A0AAD6WYK9_9AGAR|nr:hypothetical protein C8F04DRAFT_1114565 [Mycena alexandri]
MAEIAIGLLGAAASVGAAGLATGSGFTGRHESSYRQELQETKRNTDDFLANFRSGDVTPNEEGEFLTEREKAIKIQDEYHESIQSYKNTSWFNLPTKLKKRQEVRSKKRLTQQSNHSLRSYNESIYSGGSDRSSICASSGSPPGSNLAVDDVQGWLENVQSADAAHSPSTRTFYPEAYRRPVYLSPRSHSSSHHHEKEKRRGTRDSFPAPPPPLPTWTTGSRRPREREASVDYASGPERASKRARTAHSSSTHHGYRKGREHGHRDHREGRDRSPSTPSDDIDALLLESVNRSPQLHSQSSSTHLPVASVLAPSPFPPTNAHNQQHNQQICRQCGMPGRYKEGKCVEKWGPGPLGPETVCDRCRKKMKRVERRQELADRASVAVKG